MVGCKGGLFHFLLFSSADFLTAHDLDYDIALVHAAPQLQYSTSRYTRPLTPLRRFFRLPSQKVQSLLNSPLDFTEPVAT